MMSGEVGTTVNKIVYAEGTFLWWGLCIPSFRTIAYVINKQGGIWVSSVKTTSYVCNRFNTSFCTKDHKTHKAISNLNRKFWSNLTLIWVGFLGVFLPPCPAEIMSFTTITSFESVFISWILYIWLLWPISILIKNLRRRKKVFIKVFLYRFMLILVIYNNNNPFLFWWLWIIIVITPLSLIYWYYLYCLKSLETFTLTFIYIVFTLLRFILHLHFYIYISFHHIGQPHLVLQSHSCMRCLVILS